MTCAILLIQEINDGLNVPSKIWIPKSAINVTFARVLEIFKACIDI